MDFEGLLPLLVFAWLIFGFLSQRARAGRRPPDEEQGGERLPPVPGEEGRRGMRGRQLEARRRKQDALEELRRELERQFGLTTGEERGPMGRRGGGLDDAEDVEEIETLEVEPEIVSLETGWERPERPEFDAARGAEALLAGRVRAAEARLTGRTRADHREFDERIRRPPAAAAVPGPLLRAMSLRQAVMWREVLGPPRALQ